MSDTHKITQAGLIFTVHELMKIGSEILICTKFAFLTLSPSLPSSLQLSQVARDQYEALIEHIESEQQQQS